MISKKMKVLVANVAYSLWDERLDYPTALNNKHIAILEATIEKLEHLPDLEIDCTSPVCLLKAIMESKK